ncbi:hypothetical protein RFI_03968 [Reticulomyxa filosa]|uniref:Uncharacterized protein n=1 Tax=Reticulomyxa filosa TaxID=46433 RepID=X6P4U0_RETFI|nr:hypothetical protein RFI_03968 [Reticulomyxa filosa]|eukprot:ETO33138.1 hypothetical protein RFI_03968 [Reticulomyxa filosa]
MPTLISFTSLMRARHIDNLTPDVQDCKLNVIYNINIRSTIFAMDRMMPEPILSVHKSRHEMETDGVDVDMQMEMNEERRLRSGWSSFLIVSERDNNHITIWAISPTGGFEPKKTFVCFDSKLFIIIIIIIIIILSNNGINTNSDAHVNTLAFQKFQFRRGDVQSDEEYLFVGLTNGQLLRYNARDLLTTTFHSKQTMGKLIDGSEYVTPEVSTSVGQSPVIVRALTLSSQANKAKPVVCVNCLSRTHLIFQNNNSNHHNHQNILTIPLVITSHKGHDDVDDNDVDQSIAMENISLKTDAVFVDVCECNGLFFTLSDKHLWLYEFQNPFCFHNCDSFFIRHQVDLRYTPKAMLIEKHRKCLVIIQSEHRPFRSPQSKKSVNQVLCLCPNTHTFTYIYIYIHIHMYIRICIYKEHPENAFINGISSRN